MLDSFFEYDNSDSASSDEVQFYICRLKQNIGNTKIGTVFPAISFNFVTGELICYDIDNKIITSIKLVIA